MKEERNWRNVTISRKEWDVLRFIVKLSNIKYYPQEDGDGTNVSLLVNEEEENFINGCLDAIYALENK